jgi:hypothetical protein
MSEGKRSSSPAFESPRLFDVEPYERVEPDTTTCQRCGAVREPLPDDPRGIDPCLQGYLPDVAHACCGHDNPERAYVVIAAGAKPNQWFGTLNDPQVLHGDDALRYFTTFGVGPPRGAA